MDETSFIQWVWDGGDRLFQLIRMTQLAESVRKAMFDEIRWQQVGSRQEPKQAF